jgi:hypothetical protein
MKRAIPILDNLVMTQNYIPGVWYTYALAHYNLGNYKKADKYLLTAKEFIQKGEGMGVNEMEDDTLEEGVEKLETALKNLRYASTKFEL